MLPKGKCPYTAKTVFCDLKPRPEVCNGCRIYETNDLFGDAGTNKTAIALATLDKLWEGNSEQS